MLGKGGAGNLAQRPPQQTQDRNAGRDLLDSFSVGRSPRIRKANKIFVLDLFTQEGLALNMPWMIPVRASAADSMEPSPKRGLRVEPVTTTSIRRNPVVNPRIFQPPSLPASQPPSLPASQPPSLPASRSAGSSELSDTRSGGTPFR
jgi:hypothetical protein